MTACKKSGQRKQGKRYTTNGKRSGNRSQQASEYNKREYEKKTFRYRRESELAEKIAEFGLMGDISLNLLITRLLCEHFQVPIPHREHLRFTRKLLMDSSKQRISK